MWVRSPGRTAKGDKFRTTLVSTHVREIEIATKHSRNMGWLYDIFALSHPLRSARLSSSLLHAGGLRSNLRHPNIFTTRQTSSVRIAARLGG